MSNQPDQQEETIPMQDTPVPPFVADLTAAERAQLVTDAHLRTLPGALAAIPDPRKRRGQRYDLPFLLTCLVAALLCDCHSVEALGRWTRDRRLCSRLCSRGSAGGGGTARPRARSIAACGRACRSPTWSARWAVGSSRHARCARAPLSCAGKTVRGARTAAH